MTAPLDVLAPVAGTTMAMIDVDDPVFSEGFVGPGIAIVPDPETGRNAIAPFDGTLIKVHPHAFVLKGDDGHAVLVHLGINTVQLEGEGFTVHHQQGDTVKQGDVLITWDPAAVEASGRSSVCPIVALEAPFAAITAGNPDGTAVSVTDTLFVWG
ncbi:PTS sugar transporter subunit IIA [Sanguibacter sp. A247]|uniref:PTS sugar transporter subunit IIA n=1 Tax=unclassified Sanguibacter TaxID=2645534 RepID=UPI003FD70686